MRLSKTDLFHRYLINATHTCWSTHEVIEIFKHRYGESGYANALANFLMDALGTHTRKPRLSKKDKAFAKILEKDLANYRNR